MAVSARFVDASRANFMLGRKTGKGGNFGGRRNVGVMASVACPGLKEEYKTLRLKSDATQKEVKKAYRCLALQGYGLTESTGAVTFTSTNEEKQKYGTAGLLAANMEAKIVDIDTGKPLPQIKEASSGCEALLL